MLIPLTFGGFKEGIKEVLENPERKEELEWLLRCYNWELNAFKPIKHRRLLPLNDGLKKHFYTRLKLIASVIQLLGKPFTSCPSSGILFVAGENFSFNTAFEMPTDAKERVKFQRNEALKRQTQAAARAIFACWNP